jgi:hypothetical protein
VVLDLDKSDLISLVKGSTPSYILLGHKDITGRGHFNGSYGTWSWDSYNLDSCSEEQLIQIYRLYKTNK